LTVEDISEGNCDGLGHIFVTILTEAILFVKIVAEVYQNCHQIFVLHLKNSHHFQNMPGGTK